MKELFGKLQMLTKKIIMNKEFKDSNNDIRLIVLSACQSQKIG
jgi:CHAT domain-containing protein